jgi:prepilin-type N-terminal cleavage/methylation domain-containing protein
MFHRRGGDNLIGEDKLVERGFTLVEMLIVIVILGILAGIVVFAVGNLTSNAQSTGCKAEKTSVQDALESYKAQAGVYPTAAAAGGGSHKAMDLLTGNAATAPPFGTLLKSVPVHYTVDDSGNLTPNAAGTAAGCS